MPATQLEREILETLVEAAPMDVNEIAHRIDGHPLTVERICDGLREDGHIYTLGRGRYDVTNRGTRRVTVDHEVEPGPGGGAESEADS